MKTTGAGGAAGRRATVVTKIANARITNAARYTTSIGPDSTSFLTVAPMNDEDVSMAELDDRNVLSIPRRSHNICGAFLDKTCVIMEPIDDPVERDLGIVRDYRHVRFNLISPNFSTTSTTSTLLKWLPKNPVCSFN